MFFKSFASAAASLSLFAGLASAYTIHDVFVGGEGQLKFFPEHISAAPGDRIRFTFGRKNHTVTQSTFDSPCSPMTDAHGMQNGFFSGYMPVAEGQTHDLPQFWIGVHDEKPIWAYCQQGNHCQQGMVFAVNAPADPSPKSFANWKAKAAGGSAPTAPATTTTPSENPHASPDPYAPPSGGQYTDQYGYPASSPYSDPYGAAPTTQSYPAGSGTTAAPAPTASKNPDPEYPSVITVTQTVTVATSTWTTVYGSYPGSSDPTPNPEPVVHKVTVGGSAGLVFQPASIKAKPKDIVQFQFLQKNHTVTQSTFQAPCVKKAGGFDSGFVPTAADATVFTTWNLTIENTEPIWAFCAQGNHCTSGMVFSINAVETSEINQDSFLSKAKALAQQAPSSGTVPASSAVPTVSTTPNPNSALGRFESPTALLATLVLAGVMMAL